jgi:predicted anti-sigma-YlaC factor YlaD
MFDVLYVQNPSHIGLAVTTGSLHVMYANAFVQAEAERLPIMRFDEQNAEYERAEMHYLRGRNYILDALEQKYRGFKDDITSGDGERIARAAKRLDKNDVNAAYWLGAGWLGAFSLDPLNYDLLMTIEGAVAVLEAAVAFDPDYSRGAIWDVLFAFYAAAPADFGGDAERAEECFAQSVRASGGKLPGPYVTYAQSVCVQRQDAAGFRKMLTTALAVDPDDIPESRLATIIAQQKARWLLEHQGDYFLE